MTTNDMKTADRTTRIGRRPSRARATGTRRRARRREEWRPVVGWEGYYEVSDLGRVRRIAAYRSTSVGRVLKPWRNVHGYRQVTLTHRGRRHAPTVHRLVTDAFLGPLPAGMERNHRSGAKDDNRLTNLEFVTHPENVRHALRLGLVARQSGRFAEAA